ncbi:hypothetical protein HYH03_010255 [Edaphochlamys debaryana]|uniref:Uncharacterized protein n=1 Tax=Edaphochlamys debaryana TaxID=47281 RepID=A0A836BWG7_9CHLO|nr:hypothetical protein HYH03_010255 [Edaphochlamys debaryana]|eukprot:KAG2491470.1 hypothetical protein HYH03_010255 [Edaphochlamys debaryana]
MRAAASSKDATSSSDSHSARKPKASAKSAGGGVGKSRKWTNEEVGALLAAVGALNPADTEGINWVEVAKHVPTRTGKQCREKWRNDLRPDISKEPWSSREEYIVCRIHCQVGNQWADIGRFLPGRAENSIKNHYNATLRSKAEAKPPSLLWVYGKQVLANGGCTSVETFDRAIQIYQSMTNVEPLALFAVEDEDLTAGTGPGAVGVALSLPPRAAAAASRPAGRAGSAAGGGGGARRPRKKHRRWGSGSSEDTGGSDSEPSLSFTSGSDSEGGEAHHPRRASGGISTNGSPTPTRPRAGSNGAAQAAAAAAATAAMTVGAAGTPTGAAAVPLVGAAAVRQHHLAVRHGPAGRLPMAGGGGRLAGSSQGQVTTHALTEPSLLQGSCTAFASGGGCTGGSGGAVEAQGQLGLGHRGSGGYGPGAAGFYRGASSSGHIGLDSACASPLRLSGGIPATPPPAVAAPPPGAPPPSPLPLPPMPPPGACKAERSCGPIGYTHAHAFAGGGSFGLDSRQSGALQTQHRAHSHELHMHQHTQLEQQRPQPLELELLSPCPPLAEAPGGLLPEACGLAPRPCLESGGDGSSDGGGSRGGGGSARGTGSGGGGSRDGSGGGSGGVASPISPVVLSPTDWPQQLERAFESMPDGTELAELLADIHCDGFAAASVLGPAASPPPPPAAAEPGPPRSGAASGSGSGGGGSSSPRASCSAVAGASTGHVATACHGPGPGVAAAAPGGGGCAGPLSALPLHALILRQLAMLQQCAAAGNPATAPAPPSLAAALLQAQPHASDASGMTTRHPSSDPAGSAAPPAAAPSLRPLYGLDVASAAAAAAAMVVAAHSSPPGARAMALKSRAAAAAGWPALGLGLGGLALTSPASQPARMVPVSPQGLVGRDSDGSPRHGHLL